MGANCVWSLERGVWVRLRLLHAFPPKAIDLSRSRLFPLCSHPLPHHRETPTHTLYKGGFRQPQTVWRETPSAAGVVADNERLQLWPDLLHNSGSRNFESTFKYQTIFSSVDLLVRKFNNNCFYPLCALLSPFHLHNLLDIMREFSAYPILKNK